MTAHPTKRNSALHPASPPPAGASAREGGHLPKILSTLVALLTAPATADTASVVQDHSRPGFAAFAEAAQSLAAIESCDPAALRPAFNATFDAWMQVAHLTLGPAEEDGRGLAVLFWPDPKGSGWKAQRALLDSPPTAEDMAQHSVAARGLPALERLLYPIETLATDPCPLIRVTADDLATTATALNAAWGPYGDLLLTAGQPGNTRFLKPEEATQALFTQLATGLEALADRRIGRPLGTFDKPRPDLAEAHASARSVRNIALSLAALRDLALTLDPDSPKTLAAFDHAIALAEGLDPDIDRITDPQGWLKLEILQQAVRSTRDTVVAELGPALGVELGFNSQDGD
ncbi:imelysin family protein [Rhodobacter sp. SY28-1]|uniref:imelysin family protein n=1 Tax=Rhodobacter sp. SY28-1 TaxID=2562317 RepID=UPI0010BF8DFE|nr:imelysin family protein [Rhodobacter sp. SY28-1]